MSNYSINSLEQYFQVYRRSIRKPKKFWGKIAENNFTWYQKWDKVLEFDMEKAEFTWFKNARLNITKNCIDRHLANKGDKNAIIFEPNNPEEPSRYYTYSELYAEVSRMANVLVAQGVQ
jgi:acetyl-CoA synthetase